MEQPDLFGSSDTARKAAARFFVRVGQVSRATAPKDTKTRPLFSLLAIIAAGEPPADIQKV